MGIKFKEIERYIYISIIVLLSTSITLLYIGGSGDDNKIAKNNSGSAWGYEKIKEKNICGYEYNLKEIEELGNLINLYNCPEGKSFVEGLGKPYQITSVYYQRNFKQFDRKIWVNMLATAYYSYLDYWDYLKPRVVFGYSLTDNYESLFIEVSSKDKMYCIGPNIDYVKRNGNIYEIKGAQAEGTTISESDCVSRIKEAKAAGIKISVNGNISNDNASNN